MAVLGTERSVVWRGVELTDRGAARRLDLAIALAKVAALAALVVTCAGFRYVAQAPLRSVTNPETGIRIYYPLRWKEAGQWGAVCWASERDPLAAGAGGTGINVLLVALPFRLSAGGPWPGGPSRAENWSAAEVAAAVAPLLRFRGPPNLLELRRTRLLGGPAVELIGPRDPPCWGSAVVRVEGECLLIYQVRAASRSAYRRFEPTWRRMVRRAARVGEAAPLDLLYGKGATATDVD